MVSVVADPLGEGTVEALLPQQIMMQVAGSSLHPRGEDGVVALGHRPWKFRVLWLQDLGTWRN